MYRKMLMIRRFDEKAVELYQAGELPGFLHPYIGEEATAVGVCANLRKDDYITSTHRGHGHLIAKGGRMDKMMAELHAKSTGYCKGKGGSMHIADVSLGILGANGIVGAGIPIATGAALSAKMRKTDQVVASFFGDGASNQGTFHEALNLASIWELPVVFVCENNQYGMGTPQKQHQKIKDISVRADAYAMPGISIDGNDIIEVYETANEAISRARAGDGPTLIECKTYRLKGHHVGDPGTSYRTRNEVEEWQQRDPIPRLKTLLLKEETVSESELEAIEAEVLEELQKAIQFAKDSQSPEPEDALDDLFA
jgi:pyruvate dehydrogenase E1 component alpha subunit